jgi:hypothetical protein
MCISKWEFEGYTPNPRRPQEIVQLTKAARTKLITRYKGQDTQENYDDALVNLNTPLQIPGTRREDQETERVKGKLA